jgi:hypothetical protein
MKHDRARWLVLRRSCNEARLCEVARPAEQLRWSTGGDRWLPVAVLVVQCWRSRCWLLLVALITTCTSLLVSTVAWCPSQFTTDGPSVSTSWCRVLSGAHDQIVVNCLTVAVLSCSCALSDERSGLSFVAWYSRWPILICCQLAGRGRMRSWRC